MRRRDEKFPDNGFEAWGGYMQAKISKLEEQFSSRAKQEENLLSSIFSGVSIYVNGYTVPSADELKNLMSRHGGVYHTYQRNDDYIIASNLPDTKVKNMSLGKVVRPEWITESIAAGRLLDYRDYLLYRNSRNQPRLNFDKVVDKDQSSLPSCLDGNKVLKLENEDKNVEVFKESKSSKQSSVSTENQEKVNNIARESNTILCDENFGFKAPKQITKTAADPNFISEFYNNSRLHHISQMGACFKQYINDLRENSNLTFPLRTELKEKINALDTPNLSPIYFEKGKVIMHIDMDCFFVSVGLRNRPDLKGKPVAVTHSKGGQGRSKRAGVDRNSEFKLYRQKQVQKLGKALGKPEKEVVFQSRVDHITDEDDKYGSMSEIASCSYEARAKGISNGMFMGTALKLCPDIQTIPYDFEGYKEVAYTLYNTIAKYTLDIEAVSCDEMYVDCTDLLKDINASAQDFATVLRNEIKTKTGCPCSTGFGGNRLQARLATKRAKPDGQFFLTEDLVADFMFDIKLRDLPGVGRQISQKLESLGHQTCGSLQSLSLAALKCHLGVKTGTQLFDQCRGRDPQPLQFHTVRKSVSAEVNYGIRFENNDQCMDFLKQLSLEVQSRMQQFKVIGKCVTLKLMVRAKDAPVETAKFMGHGFCDVINKSTTFSNATNDADLISKEVISICKKLNIDPKEMRGVGIQMTKLESLNSKPIKGAINKYLSTKSITNEMKVEKNASDRLGDSNKLVLEQNAVKATSETNTPKKVKPISPAKKSPIIGPFKSPPSRKRGRPPKSHRLHTSTSKNLMSKFLQGQPYAKDTPYQNPMIKQQKVTIEQSNINVDNRKSHVVNEVNKKQHDLIGLPWDEVRELLRAWLESGQTPLPCDVEMISAYMREMVVTRNIDKVNILIKFLKRRTSEMKCEKWIGVYNEVVEQVQNAMVAIYGKRLWITD